MKKENMVKFKTGVYTTSNEDEIIFLSFHPSNPESEKLSLLEKSLPRIDGLKRRKNRLIYTLKLKNEMDKNGLVINTQR